ncbi:MAG: phosphoribosylanthranilate isomerase [Coriobacteriales bacterium]|nr:phosphoribosylanthranilate isomerase [Coriobacteriales bacterium]
MSAENGKTRVKLCGMFRPEDIDAVNQVRPDFVGFVVDFPRSHRSVSPQELAELAPCVASGIRRVGVFVNEPVEIVASLYEQGLIHVAQLHGGEDEQYLASLRAICPVPTIQAFKVRTAADVVRAQASTANLVLLDNGQGTGEVFDWSLLEGVGRPFMLAGGLGPHNVAEAIAAVHPWGVDMSSGIETSRIKDPTKMAAAVAAARGAI